MTPCEDITFLLDFIINVSTPTVTKISKIGTIDFGIKYKMKGVHYS